MVDIEGEKKKPPKSKQQKTPNLENIENMPMKFQLWIEHSYISTSVVHW